MGDYEGHTTLRVAIVDFRYDFSFRHKRSPVFFTKPYLVLWLVQSADCGLTCLLNHRLTELEFQPRCKVVFTARKRCLGSSCFSKYPFGRWRKAEYRYPRRMDPKSVPSKIIERVPVGLLSPYIESYVALVNEQGFAPPSVHEQIRVIVMLSHLLERSGYEIQDLDESVTQESISNRGPPV